MEYFTQGKSFIFTTEIRDNPALRNSFFSLAQQTFDLDFEPWYQGGGWQDRSLPHALVYDGQVAANVSVNRISFQLERPAPHLSSAGHCHDPSEIPRHGAFPFSDGNGVANLV